MSARVSDQYAQRIIASVERYAREMGTWNTSKVASLLNDTYNLALDLQDAREEIVRLRGEVQLQHSVGDAMTGMVRCNCDLCTGESSDE